MNSDLTMVCNSIDATGYTTGTTVTWTDPAVSSAIQLPRVDFSFRILKTGDNFGYRTIQLNKNAPVSYYIPAQVLLIAHYYT